MRIEISKLSRVFDGSMSLGVSRIYGDTLTVDGGALPEGMELDARGGNVHWQDQENLGERSPYLFEFARFRAARCTFEADKTQIAADSTEEVTVTVTCEDTTEAIVPMEILRDGESVGTVEIVMGGGSGLHMLSTEAAGTYRFQADKAVLDNDWSVAKYRTAQTVAVEAV